MAPHKCL